MQKKRPRKTNWWVCTGLVLNFLITERVCLVVNAINDKPEMAPTTSWWVTTISVETIIEGVNITFVALQDAKQREKKRFSSRTSPRYSTSSASTTVIRQSWNLTTASSSYTDQGWLTSNLSCSTGRIKNRAHVTACDSLTLTSISCFERGCQVCCRPCLWTASEPW